MPGCYNRARHFATKVVEILRLKKKGSEFNDPFTLFVYGNFVYLVKKGSPGEKLTWTYHVTPIIKLKDGELYVLDPLISHRPIKKADYFNLLKSTEGSQITGYVTCKPGTYDGSATDCFNPTEEGSYYFHKWTQDFLTM